MQKQWGPSAFSNSWLSYKAFQAQILKCLKLKFELFSSYYNRTNDLLKVTKHKIMHCSQAEDSQPLNANAMAPTSHAAPRHLGLSPATQRWRIRNEFISCFLYKWYTEIPYQSICGENCWPCWEYVHQAGIYWGNEEGLSCFLHIVSTWCKMVPRHVTYSQLDWRDIKTDLPVQGHSQATLKARYAFCSNNGLQNIPRGEVIHKGQKMLGCKGHQKMPCLWIIWKVSSRCCRCAIMLIHIIGFLHLKCMISSDSPTPQNGSWTTTAHRIIEP